MKNYELKKRLYDSEKNDYSLNQQCETKFVDILKNAVPDMLVQDQTQHNIAFGSVHSYLKLEILREHSSQVLNSELKGFVKVRTDCQLKQSKIVYANVPGIKEQLLKRCVELKAVACSEPLCATPTFPTLLSVD